MKKFLFVLFILISFSSFTQKEVYKLKAIAMRTSESDNIFDIDLRINVNTSSDRITIFGEQTINFDIIKSTMGDEELILTCLDNTNEECFIAIKETENVVSLRIVYLEYYTNYACLRLY